MKNNSPSDFRARSPKLDRAIGLLTGQKAFFDKQLYQFKAGRIVHLILYVSY
jgi:hypothetical protein